MFRGLGFGNNRAAGGQEEKKSSWQKKSRTIDEDEEDDDGDYDENEYNSRDNEEEDNDSQDYPPDRYDGNILSSDQEKSKVLIMFKDLRSDGMFCDITFLCQGKEFHAHKVVVSAWSRWLRALLCEEQPTEDRISVDVFDPQSFGKIIDYMYGVPLAVTLENAEALLKVVHRLQLQGLEESIWIFLMKIVDPYNCKQLHDLADRYDCPPLKLSALKVLNESIPAYSSLPSSIMAATGAAGVLKGTGLTGPGEADFLSNLPPTQNQPGAHPDEIMDELPSIFSQFSPPPPSAGDGDDEDESALDELMGETKHKTRVERRDYLHPKELPQTASASDLVKAWSARLQDVLQMCNAPEGEDFLDPESMEAELGKKIMYTSGRGMGSPKMKNGKAINKKSSAGNRSPGKYSHIREINWRSELKAFYLGINMPEKLPGIGEILHTWRGKEEQMLSHLITKYKRSIPAALADHLKTLSDYVETQTESSFVR